MELSVKGGLEASSQETAGLVCDIRGPYLLGAVTGKSVHEFGHRQSIFSFQAPPRCFVQNPIKVYTSGRTGWHRLNRSAMDCDQEKAVQVGGECQDE